MGTNSITSPQFKNMSAGIDPARYVRAIAEKYPDETELRLLLQHFPQIINPYARDILDFVDRRLRAERTLDAGCGAGWISHYFRDQTEVYGVDISPVQVEKFQRLFEATEDPYAISRQDLTSLAFTANSFDGVISIGATSVVNDLDAFFSEMSRVLEPGGEFHVTVPEWNRFSSGSDEWISLFRAHGFRVDAVGHCGCLLDKYAVRVGRMTGADVGTIRRILTLRDRYLPLDIDQFAQDRIYRLIREV